MGGKKNIKQKKSEGSSKVLSVMVCLDTNIFLFFSFDFLFIDNEEACDHSHMTYHMM